MNKETLKQVISLISGQGAVKNEQVSTFLKEYTKKAKVYNWPCSPLGVGFSEGSQSHLSLSNALVKELKRNLSAGERKRLAWLANGSTKQQSTIKMTANTSHRARLRVAKGQNIGLNKAIKNIV